jgi:phenylacetyl-CoA:acceptor oxidoreductase subunit 1
VHEREYAYGDGPTKSEEARFDVKRMGVATKCTWCVDRIDDGLAKGLTPGVDPEATPACVNSCIANAYTFGDLHDPESNVSKKVEGTSWFRMHEELGTDPHIFYVVDEK